MTPVASQSETQLRERLHRHGLRYSKPRGTILAYFQERDKHVSAEALYLELKERGHQLSLSTVYLNLAVLKEAGLIREFPGRGGESLYDSSVNPHQHLICKQCGEVMDLPLVNLAGETPAALLRRHAERFSGWQVDEPRLDLLGLCSSCDDEL